MVTKSDGPGLLSKMALFVRNPTKDWSDLDKPDPVAESGYDKHALKAMIERKRQNDFVRRREFDQLRKMRKREVGAAGGVLRPSIFQTSLATDPDGRAVTLKKIDEIEAQMSKQWWKGKQEPGAQGDGFPVSERSAVPAQKTAEPVLPAASPSSEQTQTAVFPARADESEFVETEMGTGMSPMLGSTQPANAHHGLAASPLAGQTHRYENTKNGLSLSKPSAMEVGDLQTDPELEEAAIRFANGDDKGAESGLLEALRADAILPDVAFSWTAALLDLYRVTDNRIKFDQTVVEFASRFCNGVPKWINVGMTAGAGVESSASALVSADRSPVEGAVVSDAMWECPGILTDQAMEQLRENMGSRPMPWLLDWSRLTRISANAMPLMAGLFASLCDEPVALRFIGSDRLEKTLRAMVPSGDKSVERSWWGVRLNALRTMQMQDEFEMGALDYCVTYEVAPPVWEAARCQFERVGAAHTGLAHEPTAPMGLNGSPAAKLALRGDVLGDATTALVGADGIRRGGDKIVVSCQDLVRVDFAAAGSILNWVALRHAEGCQVQFHDVHRLVAAFFNVIGINEYARVVPRSV